MCVSFTSLVGGCNSTIVIFRCAGTRISDKYNFDLAPLFYAPTGGEPRTYVCWRCFHIFLDVSLRTSHLLSAKCPVGRPGKPARTHWSKSRRAPCTIERAANAQVVFRWEWAIRFISFERKGIPGTGVLFFKLLVAI